MSYCELPEFFSETAQKAKKTHVCCECNSKILPGEKYFKSTGKWDGKLSTYKQHPWCRAACTHLSNLDSYEGCIGFTTMFDAWGEVYYRREPQLKKLRKYLARVYKEMRNPSRR